MIILYTMEVSFPKSYRYYLYEKSFSFNSEFSHYVFNDTAVIIIQFEHDLKSIRPSISDSILVKVLPLAAARHTIEFFIHPAIALSKYSTAVGFLSSPGREEG